MSKSGQVAFFVIVAVVIIGLVVTFVALRGNVGFNGVPSELNPVFSSYQSCLEQQARNGLALIGSQGGYLNVGAYRPGSSYAPFSSHLSFLGMQIPYWYTLEGNNLVKEKLPTKEGMQKELANFIATSARSCDFSSFYAQGFDIKLDDASASATLDDKELKIEVTSSLRVVRGNLTAVKEQHSLIIPTRIGALYGEARSLYNAEKQEVIFEQYASDVLRSYAPVDGVNVQCSPSIWKTREVVEGIKNALEANFAQLSTKGNDPYFVIKHESVDPVRVMYSKNWPSLIEVTPANEEFMLANPVGNQEGLGVLGFCYVPYHFVYNLRFPVLVQIGEGDEIFQFPMVVVVNNNQPKATTNASSYDSSGYDVCSFANGQAQIATYDSALNPISAHVSYQCFEQTCDLGTSAIKGNEAVLETPIPTCVNGYLKVRAEGYKETSQLFSSNSETRADVILDRTYKVKVNVKVDGKSLEGNAIVHFAGEKGAVSAVLPDSGDISLPEGLYNVSVEVYGNSSIVIPASTKQQCTSVARSGVMGFFGGTREECFEVTLPETKVEYALRGGGHGEQYLLTSGLEKGVMTLYVSSVPTPKTLEQLQYNIDLVSSAGVDMDFT